MSKELEALKELKWLYNQDFSVKGWHDNGELEPLNNFLDDFYEDILKALTKLSTIEMLVDKKKFNTNDIELLRASIIEVLERDDDE